MRWFISDTHFGHAKVIEYSQRPFMTASQMDAFMIHRWNSCVKDGDEVYMLGDFGLASFNYLQDICLELNGDKILIRGNHDGTVSKMRRMGFNAVVEEAVINIAGREVRLKHYPKMGGADLLTLHGHTHEKGTACFKGMQASMCVELWDYAPVSEKVVEKLISKWEKDGIQDSRRSRATNNRPNDGGTQV